jgi:23S rRNA (guanosine2251-2'-O)-methyltransferase
VPLLIGIGLESPPFELQYYHNYLYTKTIICAIFAFFNTNCSMDSNLKLSNSELNRVDVETYKKAHKANICLILDNIRSAINVGSIFRSADAFNVRKIYLSGITATPPNKEILKSALGATASVDWEYVENAVSFVQKLLTSSDNQVLSIEQVRHAIPLTDFVPETGKQLFLVFGNEVDGVNQSLIHLSHQCIEIPQYGTKHSLNVAVSVGIVLWDLHSKLFRISTPV